MARMVRRAGVDVVGTGLTVVDDASFERKIGKRITPRPDGCWQFDDGTTEYTIIYPHGRRSGKPAHRWAFFTFNPHLDERDYPDHHVHHECRNRNCVNPKHLELLTPAEHKARHRELESI